MDKKIIAGIIIVAIIAVILLVINPFKPTQQMPTDENALLEDENLYGPKDYLTPEELAANEQQLRQSDPIRYQALQQSNIGICEQEKNASDIGWCKAAVAEKLKDESICPTLTGAPRNQCYNDVARATGKLELCNGIEKPDWRDECIAKLASINNNLDACYKITNPDWSDNCIMQIAWNRGNAGVCLKTSNDETKDDCIVDVAAETGNPDNCAGIKNPDTADNCIIQIAWNTDNADICLKVKDKGMQESCITSITG